MPSTLYLLPWGSRNQHSAEGSKEVQIDILPNFYIPQVLPSKPMVTASPSTMTGTLRAPFECFSMLSICLGSFTTLKYSTWRPSLAKASRAARVYGQASFPKSIIFADMVSPSPAVWGTEFKRYSISNNCKWLRKQSISAIFNPVNNFELTNRSKLIDTESLY